MASLPENNTTRWWLDYATADYQHSLQVRTDNTATLGQVGTFFDDFFSALIPLLAGITVVGLRRAVMGSNISVPQVWSGPSGYGGGTVGDINEPAYVSFVGRDIQGRRLRMFVYGLVGVSQGDYRWQPAESPAVTDALQVLRTAPTGVSLTIAGLLPTWNNYANTGFNAYYQRKRRGA